MRNIIVLILLMPAFIAGNVYAVPKSVKARSEYILAEKLYNEGNYEETIKHLHNAKKLLGKTNSKIQYMLVKACFKAKYYLTAQREIETYFEITEESGTSHNKYNEMIVLISEIESKILPLTSDGKLYLKKCNDGGASSCNALADMYRVGKNVTKDVQEAARLLRKAVGLYRKSCDKGDASSCYSLAYMYEKGEGVTQNMQEAARLYRKACDLGYAYACYNLAEMYREGKGVTKNMQEAVRLYNKACDLGYAYACYNLAYMYEKGRGVTKNMQEAARLYRKACDEGNALSCDNLAEMYEEGKGVTKNMQEAVRLYNKACDLYRKACDKGNARSCNDLAYMYKKGEGVTKICKRRYVYTTKPVIWAMQVFVTILPICMKKG